MALDPMTMSLLVGGGTSVLGGVLGGRSARQSAAAQKKMADTMARAQRLQEELIKKQEAIAQPFRDILYPQMQSILRGDTDLSSSPLYSTMRVPLEQQYSAARRALESRVGPSGARARAMGSLEAGRASQIGQIPGRLYQSYMDAGMGLAAGRPDLGIQGYGQMASTAASTIPMYQTGIDQGNAFMGQAGMQLGDTLYNTFLKGDNSGSAMSVYNSGGGSTGRYNLGPQYNLRTAYGG